MATKIMRSPNYDKNVAKVHGNDVPCIVCGRPIKSAAHWLHVFGDMMAVTEAEAELLNSHDAGASDLGGHPIGSDCLRKHPELKPYIQ